MVGLAPLPYFILGSVEVVYNIILFIIVTKRNFFASKQYSSNLSFILPVYLTMVYFIVLVGFLVGFHRMFGVRPTNVFVSLLKWFVLRGCTESLSLFFQQAGIGIRSIRDSLWRGFVWTIANTALICSVYIVTGFSSLFLGMCLVVLVELQLYYLVMWLAPVNLIHRRPVLFTFSWLNCLVLLLQLLAVLVSLSFHRTDDNECAVELFFSMSEFVQLIVVLIAFLQDSLFWQGIYEYKGANLNEPLIGIWDLNSRSAVKMVTDSIVHLEKKVVTILPFSKLRVDTSKFFSGGSARVYRGYYKEHEVAVKFLFCIELTPARVIDFCQEATLLNSLQHPNVVLCYGVAIMPPALTLVTEFCANGSLFDFLHCTDLLSTVPRLSQQSKDHSDNGGPGMSVIDEQSGLSGSAWDSSSGYNTPRKAMSPLPNSVNHSYSLNLSQSLNSYNHPFTMNNSTPNSQLPPLPLLQSISHQSGSKNNSTDSKSNGDSAPIQQRLTERSLPSPPPTPPKTSSRSRAAHDQSNNNSRTNSNRHSNNSNSTNRHSNRSAAHVDSVGTSNGSTIDSRGTSTHLDSRHFSAVSAGSAGTTTNSTELNPIQHYQHHKDSREQSPVNSRAGSRDDEKAGRALETELDIGAEDLRNSAHTSAAQTRAPSYAPGRGNRDRTHTDSTTPATYLPPRATGVAVSPVDISGTRSTALSSAASDSGQDEASRLAALVQRSDGEVKGGESGGQMLETAEDSGRHSWSASRPENTARILSRRILSTSYLLKADSQSFRDRERDKEKERDYAAGSFSGLGLTHSGSGATLQSASTTLLKIGFGLGPFTGSKSSTGSVTGSTGSGKHHSASISRQSISRIRKDPTAFVARRSNQRSSGNHSQQGDAVGGTQALEEGLALKGFADDSAIRDSHSSRSVSVALISLDAHQSSRHSTTRLLPGALKLRMARDCCAGLAFLHSKGFVHCDIKSLNFLVTGDMVVKLADLGEARALSEQDERILPRNINWSSPEVLMRTEDSDSEWVEQPADIWSLAMVVSEILTGEVPFDTRDCRGMTFEQFVGSLEAGLRPKIPVEYQQLTWLRTLMERAWAFNPAQRCTAAEMLAAFDSRI